MQPIIILVRKFFWYYCKQHDNNMLMDVTNGSQISTVINVLVLHSIFVGWFLAGQLSRHTDSQDLTAKISMCVPKSTGIETLQCHVPHQQSWAIHAF